jgi:hypothetical protein
MRKKCERYTPEYNYFPLPMSPRELAISYVGAAVGELFGYLTNPPDEYGCEGTYHLSATDIEQNRWSGHRDVGTSRLAAATLRHAGLDGARLDGDMLTCLFTVLAHSAETVLCYIDATA